MNDNISESLSQLFSYAVPMELRGTFQFVFSDVTASNAPTAVWVGVGKENVEVREGSGEHRDVEIRVSRQDLRDLLDGKVDVTKLFTSRRIQIQGNMSLAEELPVLVEF